MPVAVTARARWGARVSAVPHVIEPGTEAVSWWDVTSILTGLPRPGVSLSATISYPDGTSSPATAAEMDVGVWVVTAPTTAPGAHVLSVVIEASSDVYRYTGSVGFVVGAATDLVPLPSSDAAAIAAFLAAAGAAGSARAAADTPGYVEAALEQPLADIAQDAAAAAAAAATAAQAASSTQAAIVAALYARAETLAQLATLMAAASVGALGEVWGINADEGIYRKILGGALSRVSDTARQITAWQEGYKYVIAAADVEPTDALTEDASFMLSDEAAGSPTGRRLLRTSLVELIERGYQPRVSKSISADYTLTTADYGRTLFTRASEVVRVTVPAGLSSFWVRLVQLSAGPIQVVAGAGVAISPGDGWGTSGEATTVTLTALETVEGVEQYQLSGDAMLITTPGAPVLLTPSETFQVAESAAIGTVVAYYGIAITGNYAVSTEIVAGDPSGRFALDQVSRTVVVAAPLDYEAAQSYALTLRATGPGGSSEAALSIGVTDVAPAQPLAGQRFAVFEDAANGTVVGTLRANRTPTGWSLSGSSPFAVDALGRITKIGALSAAAQAQYTLSVTAHDGEGDSTPVQIEIGVVAAGAVYSPASEAAIACWDASAAAYRTVLADGTARISSLRDTLGGAGYEWQQSANWATTAPPPTLVTGSAGINGIDALRVAATQALYAPSGSAIKSWANNRSVVAFRAVIALDDASVSNEIVRLTTASSSGRVIWRIDQSTGAPKFALQARRIDTDGAATLIHQTVLKTGKTYVVYGEVNYASGTMRLIVNGTELAATVSWASGTGNSANSLSASCYLGYSNTVPSYWRLGILVPLVSVPNEATRIRNDLILSAKYGAAA